jgi:primosomal protein N'
MSTRMYCAYCGSRLHTITNCPKTWGGQARRNAMRCGYCGSREHNIAACPKTFSGSAARAWHPDDVADDFVKDR